MVQVQFDNQKIIDAVLNAKRGDGSDQLISSVAKESALELVDAWLHEFAQKDVNHEIISVESPFFIWLDEHTVVLGMMDRRQVTDVGGDYEVMGCEWKTHKEPKGKYNEEQWLEDISGGPQLAVYALAMQRGLFLGVKKLEATGIGTPIKIMVRAAVKTSPPTFWPTRPSQGVFTFGEVELESIKNTLLNRATVIRALRSTNLVPWQAVGDHCYRQFGQTCEFLEKYCLPKRHPVWDASSGKVTSPGDPGLAALDAALEYRREWMGIEPGDTTKLVVLSASTYQLSAVCLEKHRIVTSSLGETETSINLEIGTGFHAGVAEIGRQTMAIQKGEGINV